MAPVKYMRTTAGPFKEKTLQDFLRELGFGHIILTKDNDDPIIYFHLAVLERRPYTYLLYKGVALDDIEDIISELLKF
jgi:hypothetical protein